MPKLTSSDSITMGIRLTKVQRDALDQISKRTGVEVSQLIRFAVDALVEHYERSGQRLVLPINFDEIISTDAIKERSATTRKTA